MLHGRSLVLELLFLFRKLNKKMNLPVQAMTFYLESNLKSSQLNIIYINATPAN